jgi:hypothetical protein
MAVELLLDGPDRGNHYAQAHARRSIGPDRHEWDMVVNALGALAISALGRWHMTQREQSFIEVWVRKFIERNPRLFRRRTGVQRLHMPCRSLLEVPGP